jgi:lysophospholipid acyltransferase (LPLAT)-like uncharacterized protein
MMARWRSPREWPISLSLGPWLASGLMRIGVRSLRRVDVGREYPEACWARGERVIVTFWHGRLLMMPFAYPGQPGTILISQHREGEYITRIAQRLGFVVERGSATRGGAGAFRRMVHALQTGRNAVITPDGPRGPSGRVKSGVIELSRLSGMPILPVAFAAWPRIVLQSWDRFVVPYPFARGVYVWGPPLRVPPDLSRTAAEKFRGGLAERLDAVTAEADRLAMARSDQGG